METLTILLMETARRMLSPSTEVVSLVFDLTGFGLQYMDYNVTKFLGKCFEAYYPESLGSIYILNAPWVFNGKSCFFYDLLKDVGVSLRDV
jgi:hypothetical protein